MAPSIISVERLKSSSMMEFQNHTGPFTQTPSGSAAPTRLAVAIRTTLAMKLLPNAAICSKTTALIRAITTLQSRMRASFLTQ